MTMLGVQQPTDMTYWILAFRYARPDHPKSIVIQYVGNKSLATGFLHANTAVRSQQHQFSDWNSTSCEPGHGDNFTDPAATAAPRDTTQLKNAIKYKRNKSM